MTLQDLETPLRIGNRDISRFIQNFENAVGLQTTINAFGYDNSLPAARRFQDSIRTTDYNIICELISLGEYDEMKLTIDDPTASIMNVTLFIDAFNEFMNELSRNDRLKKISIYLDLQQRDFERLYFSDVIWYLDLSWNELTSIPRNIPITIQMLNLSHNRINHDLNFSRFAYLRELNLDYNGINSMNSLRLPINISELTLNDNNLNVINLTVLPDNIRILDVRNNPINQPNITSTITNRLFGTQRREHPNLAILLR